MNILYLCTGNICRSAMAEAFTLQALSTVGSVEAKIKSAGLEAEEGQTPPAEVVSVMGEHGLDISDHHAHRLEAREVEDADIILAMAKHNSQRLLTGHQEAVQKVFTLKEFIIQGKKRASGLEETDPEKRLVELKSLIRRVDGSTLRKGEKGLNHHLGLFFLHYYQIYDHRFTIDDPLGQSMDFMRRTAEEIRHCVEELLGPALLGLHNG
ncbi:MAG: hypothetical protein A2Y75_04925 [Candidatus Solincola sediminis]|uniref:Phosphotyrosine protein phosphatase I domain-containing protein n=1 Tax=Candidatus Solincola sediminis TaxID=1797199 RepID=A0A1F2WS51_9ACTN|nr:MAG: hypothetical protein A2Y75_04925 [Candidatus Solincola sediminis]